MKHIAILLIIIGGLTLAAGIVLYFMDKIPWLGSLPGDIDYRGKNFSFHFPLATCFIISFILTLLINLILRLFKK